MSPITLGTVSLNARAKKNIQLCLDRNQIGSGDFIKQFEDKIAEYLKVRNAIAVCNGTMADILSLAVLKYYYPEKTEVIVPALTFIAHTNAILVNNLKPVFVDVNEKLQIDIDQIEVNSKTLAIFPVHLLGKACDIDEIMKFGVPVAEDCCQAFGVAPKQIGTYSFFPSHTITTGEGGMIATNEDGLAGILRKMRNHGRRSEAILDKFHFDMFGLNGKMSNLIAAIGEATIEEADEIIEKRKENVAILNQATGQNWYAESPHCYPIIYKTEEERNRKLQELENSGIEARKLFSCLPTQEKVYSYMGYKEGDFPRAEEVGRRGLYVPCHQNLTDEDLNKIINVICPKILI